MSTTDEAPAEHLTAVQRFYAAIGKPVPQLFAEHKVIAQLLDQAEHGQLSSV
jgi:hypothetical protein